MPRICHNIHGVQVFHLLWYGLIYHFPQQPNTLFECFRFDMPANRAFLISLGSPPSFSATLVILSLSFSYCQTQNPAWSMRYCGMFDGGDFMVETPFGWWFEFILSLQTGHEMRKLTKVFENSSEKFFLSLHYRGLHCCFGKKSKKIFRLFLFFPSL